MGKNGEEKENKVVLKKRKNNGKKNRKSEDVYLQEILVSKLKNFMDLVYRPRWLAR